jgi:hypothetical protein
MTEALLNTLIDQTIVQEKRSDSGFKPEAWQAALAEVQKQAQGQRVTLKQVKKKHNISKADWRYWNKLSNLSGFSVTEGGVVEAKAKPLLSTSSGTRTRGSLNTPRLSSKIFISSYLMSTLSNLI